MIDYNEKFINLKNYVILNGGRINKIGFKYLSDFNFTLNASEDIQKGEEIYFIPFSCCVYRKSEPFKKVVNLLGKSLDNLGISDDSAIITYLLEFAPLTGETYYKEISELSSKLNKKNIGYYIDDNMKNILKGSQIINEINKYNELNDQAYLFIKPLLDKNNIPKEEFVDKLFLWNNRFYNFKLPDGREIMILIPIDILLNDSLNNNCICKYTEHGLNTFASKDIKKGELLTSNYYVIYEYVKNESGEDKENCNNIQLYTLYGYYFKNNTRKIRIDFNFNNKNYVFDGENEIKYDINRLTQLIYKDINQLMPIDKIKTYLKNIILDKIKNCERILENENVIKNEDIKFIINEEKNFEEEYIKYF